jgi:hypothetical protein
MSCLLSSPRVVSGLKYRMEGTWLTNPTRRRWFKRSWGEGAWMVRFGLGSHFLGYDGKLWLMHEEKRVMGVWTEEVDDDGWRGEPNVVFCAWLENVQHVLIRLQRWTRRVVV